LKITVLGRGNAGCLTALHYGYHTRNRKDISIELIYDPNIPTERVGQASQLSPPQLLWEALGINWYDNPIEATPKFGLLYENWGKKNHKFFHPFPGYEAGLQYSPRKLQETILKSGYFSVQEKHIDNYEQIDSDYIFDCRGKPRDNWDDYNMLINPLNSVILGEGESKEGNQNWTRVVATPDGWTFVIPNTAQTTSYGYLYNDEITSTKEASANFEKLFNLADQGIYLDEKVDNFKFKQYIAKTPIIDDRIILGGNRLCFLEPLESTAIECYLHWAQRNWSWIIDGNTTPAENTDYIHKYFFQLQNFVMWHYAFGSKYDTPFWEAAGKLKFEDPVFDSILEYAKKHSTIDLISSDQDNHRLGRQYSKYSYAQQWGAYSFKNWYDGMTSEKN